MDETILLNELRALKADTTYHQMSKRLDMPVSTIYRWLKTGKINKVYADVLRQRLKLP